VWFKDLAIKDNWIGMKIRKYKSGDKEAIISLFEEFGDYYAKIDPLGLCKKKSGYGEAWLKDDLKEVSKNKGVFYVAVRGGKVVGCVTAIIREKTNMRITLDDLKAGEVDVLYVSKSHRHKSIGSELMKKAENYLKEAGCKIIWVGFFGPNVVAAKFYKRFGYRHRSGDMLKIFKRTS
jgi:ribosomal protein S18 acetylase RimI-like enzyme